MSQPDDFNLESQLNDVPLPPQFVERLHAALQPSDRELDERLKLVPVPEMLTTSLTTIPSDEVLAVRLRDVPLPATLSAELRQIPWLIETKPRTTTIGKRVAEFVTAACLLLMVGGGYLYVTQLWWGKTFSNLIAEKPTEVYLAYHGPAKLTAVAMRSTPMFELPFVTDASQAAFASDEFAADAIMDVDPPLPVVEPSSSRTNEVFVLYQDQQLLQNLAVLRWGVLGARHDDRDELMHLEELPTPILQGVEPPITKGYSRAFWLKHHVLPPMSPNVKELQSLALPLAGDAAGFDRIERLLATGRKITERDVRVEDFIAHSITSLPAAPSHSIQLRGVGGPSPFGNSQTGLLQVLVQAGEFHSQQPRHYVFAVDLSASMVRGGRWQSVQRLLLSLPDSIGAADRLTLVAFREELVVALEGLEVGDAPLWRRTIQKLQPAAGADLLVGIREGLRRLTSDEGESLPPAVFTLISDHEGSLTDSAVRSLTGLLQDVQATGGDVHLIDLSSSSTHTPLQQLAAANDYPRHHASTGHEVTTAFQSWRRRVMPRVASDVNVEITFDPKSVSAYRLIGHAAGSWSHVSSLVEPVDLSSSDAVSSLIELALLPGADGPVAELQLRWRNPQTGEQHRQMAKLRQSDFRRTWHNMPPSFQRAACAAELAEVLTGTRTALREVQWSGSEPHDVTTVLNTLRQLPGSARNDPATLRLIQMTESLKRAGVK